MKQRKVQILAAAIVLLAVAAAFFIPASLNRGYLVLQNASTGQEYARYPLQKGETFSITFIHSVNATPVTDQYLVTANGGIDLTDTIYYDFGAGVPFDINDGETLQFRESDGAMVISGINRTIPDFIIFVGTVSDHTLALNGQQISLRQLCSRNAKVRITWQANPLAH